MEDIAISNTRVDAALLRNPVHFLALGLGSGLSPKAPGTAGSILALLLCIPAALWLPGGALTMALLACIVGVPVCAYTSKALGGSDHSAIVWDEFAGMWLALVLVPFNFLWWAAAFVLFRFFDVLKPWPIGWLDRNLKGGLGIMADDVAAGLVTAVLLYLVEYALF